MAETNYVAVFDPLNESFDPRALKGILKSEPRVSHWWNYLFNCFLVTFNGNADELSTLLYPAARGGKFFVMQVDPRESEGVLPERGWSWIQKREREIRSSEQPA